MTLRTPTRTPTLKAALSRREFLRDAVGLGGIALAWLMHREARANVPHFAARAKRVVMIFCPGGVSHVDTFDYKPELVKRHGQSLGQSLDTFFGQPGNLMKSPFAFRQHGQSGRWVSELFPHLSRCVDDLTFIHSLQAKSSNHTPAGFQMLTGFTMNGFPSIGAWVSYGLGNETDELPTYVVLPDPRGLPAGGAINWSSAFLPANHQGVPLRTQGEPVLHLNPAEPVEARLKESRLQALREANQEFFDVFPGDRTLAGRIRSYELAAKMQLAVPEAVEISREDEATQRLYGLDEPATAGFGRNCLLARRLLERGVRFVQLFHGGAFGSPRVNWDAHENIVANHRDQALSADKPLAGLLTDLKRRGMLDDTLVLWTTEFGRTPITQGINAPGRDHHPQVFTVWLAGGGCQRGLAYGASDEIGLKPAEKPTTIYDLHATVLHLLGLDHTRLTYYHNGIQRRLTDVHGEVIRDIVA